MSLTAERKTWRLNPDDPTGQILLTWEVPVGAVRTLLLRKTRDFPLSTEDGTVVLDTADMGIVDIEDDEFVSDKINYYRVFFHDGVAWIPDDVAGENQTYIHGYGLFEWQNKLYGNMPDVYRRLDNEQNPALPLYRFFGLIGERLEVLRQKYEATLDFDNPAEVEQRFLEALAWDVGWLVNRELPILRQRAEIKRAVRNYKRKGTGEGLKELLRAIVGWDLEVIDPKRNILVSNRIDSTTAPTNDPAALLLMGNEGDTVDYTWGGRWKPWIISIRMIAKTDWEIFNTVRNKLFRVFATWVPICVEIILDVSTVNEDEFTIAPEVWEDDLVLNHLITNDTDKVTNDLKWRTPILTP